MNHFETGFSFTQLRRERTKGQHSLASYLFLIFSFLHPVSFSYLPTSQFSLPCLTFMSLCSVSLLSLSHNVSPQLWRTAGSSWWISLTTNCGCLCPMCHSPMRDAMCASSTQILLRKPTQTSLSWVGVRVHVWTSRTYHTPHHTCTHAHFYCISLPYRQWIWNNGNLWSCYL